MKIVLKQVYDDLNVKEPVPAQGEPDYVYQDWWNLRNEVLNNPIDNETLVYVHHALVNQLDVDDRFAVKTIDAWRDLAKDSDYMKRRNRKPEKPPIITEMLKQIHERLHAYQLREGFTSQKDFDVSTVVKPGSISKWEGKPAKQIIEAAKLLNDTTAIEYIFWKMKGAITSTFWNKYLGPNGTIRRYRIQNEDAWEQWLGIAWMSLVGGFKEGTAAGRTIQKTGQEREGSKGALETYKLNDADNDDAVWGKFAKLFKQILFNSAYHANNSTKGGGMYGNTETVMQYEPTWAGSDDGEGEEGELYHDETYESAESNLSAEQFLPRWEQFVQSAALQQGSKGITPAMVFYEVIDDPKAEFRQMAAKFGISRNTCADLMTKAQNEMAKYDITGQELMNAIKVFGNDKIASYLRPVPSSASVEEIVKENPKLDDHSPSAKQQSAGQNPPPTVDKKDSFKDKFSKLMMDNGAWAPHIKEVDVANWIYYWISSGFKSPEEVGAENGIRKTDAKYWHPRALKLLKKYGISEADLKKAVKEYGKDDITDLIGEDNDGSW
jgi:hypothetical protein